MRQPPVKEVARGAALCSELLPPLAEVLGRGLDLFRSAPLVLRDLVAPRERQVERIEEVDGPLPPREPAREVEATHLPLQVVPAVLRLLVREQAKRVPEQ